MHPPSDTVRWMTNSRSREMAEVADDGDDDFVVVVEPDDEHDDENEVVDEDGPSSLDVTFVVATTFRPG